MHLVDLVVGSPSKCRHRSAYSRTGCTKQKNMTFRFLTLLVVSLACALCWGFAAAAPRPRPLLLNDTWSACRCTREFNAVCGNDGVTYSNKCLLECARAQRNSRMGQALKLVRYGVC